jgi:hypothetical protein
MVITIRERDELHKSHDANDAMISMWDVYQGDVLVGVYHNESDALRYKELLESGRLDELSPPKK